MRRPRQGPVTVRVVASIPGLGHLTANGETEEHFCNLLTKRAYSILGPRPTVSGPFKATITDLSTITGVWDKKAARTVEAYRVAWLLQQGLPRHVPGTGYALARPWPADCRLSLEISTRDGARGYDFRAEPEDLPTYVLGTGPTPEHAEERAWTSYQRQVRCPTGHDAFDPGDRSDGTGHCTGCGMYAVNVCPAPTPRTDCTCGRDSLYFRSAEYYGTCPGCEGLFLCDHGTFHPTHMRAFTCDCDPGFPVATPTGSTR